ncbi:C-C motif chemokine 5-like [Varanus komodoensis]|uniref:C-C motif chemokine 5-like n=1 Tax=Varanus komodoensis TaxID=61221 RepID=UPI001CF76CDD|nr:C-C motif chemokine 5-like [Varanus komodoensis]
MKTSAAAFAMLLVLACFCLAVTSPLGVGNAPCCNAHTSKRIPARIVKSFFHTSGTCRLPSIVFILKNGKQACANPRDPWVIAIKDRLEQI